MRRRSGIFALIIISWLMTRYNVSSKLFPRRYFFMDRRYFCKLAIALPIATTGIWLISSLWPPSGLLKSCFPAYAIIHVSPREEEQVVSKHRTSPQGELTLPWGPNSRHLSYLNFEVRKCLKIVYTGKPRMTEDRKMACEISRVSAHIVESVIANH